MASTIAPHREKLKLVKYVITPFICKMTRNGVDDCDAHFPDQKTLELHVKTEHVDSLKCNKQSKESNAYLCPWKGCDKPHYDLAPLKGIK